MAIWKPVLQKNKGKKNNRQNSKAKNKSPSRLKSIYVSNANRPISNDHRTFRSLCKQINTKHFIIHPPFLSFWPASKTRKASGSPSLPPASQPTTPPSNYKNKTPLIATGIDPKYNTPIKIMRELRQYHPSLRVLQIKQTKNGWIFIGDTPKDFSILQSEAKVKQVFGPKVKVSLPRSYHSADASKVNFWYSREYLSTSL